MSRNVIAVLLPTIMLLGMSDQAQDFNFNVTAETGASPASVNDAKRHCVFLAVQDEQLVIQRNVAAVVLRPQVLLYPGPAWDGGLRPPDSTLLYQTKNRALTVIFVPGIGTQLPPVPIAKLPTSGMINLVGPEAAIPGLVREDLDGLFLFDTLLPLEGEQPKWFGIFSPQGALVGIYIQQVEKTVGRKTRRLGVGIPVAEIARVLEQQRGQIELLEAAASPAVRK